MQRVTFSTIAEKFNDYDTIAGNNRAAQIKKYPASECHFERTPLGVFFSEQGVVLLFVGTPYDRQAPSLVISSAESVANVVEKSKTTQQ